MRFHTILLPVLLAASLLAVGCDDPVTQEGISEQQQEIAKTQEELQQLKDEMEARVERAAAEARKEKRDELEKRIAEMEQSLAGERQELTQMQARYEFERPMHRKLLAVERKIDQLEDIAAAEAEAGETKLKGQVAQLRTQYVQVEQQFEQLTEASGQQWEQRKAAFETGYNRLDESVEQVFRQATAVQPTPEQATQQ